MWIAVLCLLLFLKYKGHSLAVDRRSLISLFAAGIVIAAHWITFFHAIKISNISITLACLSSGAFFASLIEPIVFKRKLDIREVIMGGMVVVGISTIFAVEFEHVVGIITALVSAALSASFSVINGLMVRKHKPSVITTYELLGGWLAIGIYLLFDGRLAESIVAPSKMDFLYLVILGSICTAYAFIESVKVMKHLSPFTVMLTINLEPIYGILLAFLFFGNNEQMSLGFYIGTSIILIAVIFNGILKRKRKQLN